MKISSHRRVRKYLNFFKNNFELKSPYQIIVDETFCLETLICKITFQEQMPKYLEDQNTIMHTTSCVIKDTKKLGQKGHEALDMLKGLKTWACEHQDEPVSSLECLFSLVKSNNPGRLFIATQNQDLINKCRSIASVPVMYVLNNTICLENPTSSRTLQVKRKAIAEAPKAKKANPPKRANNSLGDKDDKQSQEKLFTPTRPFKKKRFGSKKRNSDQSQPNRTGPFKKNASKTSFQKKKFGNKKGDAKQNQPEKTQLFDKNGSATNGSFQKNKFK